MNAISHAQLTAVLGPTNTGKTHLAVERMLAHQSGMIGFPLRLLAREVYDRVVAIKGPERVALITGEEMILPRFADYFLCTVESMPLHREVAFLAIDEIQMCADPDRGHVFTDRLLRARGAQETMLLGADTIKPLLRSLLPKAEFVSRPRFSKLSALGPKKLSRLPRRSAVVAFSTDDVYAMAEILRRQKGGVAIVMGALSPRTRNAQVELYQNGDVDYLVATDAIGMGLNMDIDHVAFAALKKFDGRRFRQLSAAEIGQIAGRAGRHMTDGTFGSIGGLDDGGNMLDSDMIERIETHRFEKLKNLYWRQSDLDFSSLDRLIGALEQRPNRPEFLRAHEASDLSALKWLAAQREIRNKCQNSSAVERLWQACQIPDFRKVSSDLHAKLIGRIFGHLTEKDGKIPEDWIDGQVRRLDNIQGDIDTLAGRIAGIRIWTYISHRPGWLARPEHWAAETRRVEDALSDALHQRLTQRFVDRRTSVLLRELRQRGELMVDIEQGLQGDDVSVEGHHIGRLEGFSFHVDPAAAHEEQKTLRATAERALRQEVERRAQMLCQGGDSELSLDTARGLDRPRIKWRGATIADMDAGPELLAPKVSLMTGSLLDGVAAQQVLERLDHWVKTQVETLLEPLIRIRDTLKAQAQGKADVALTGTARGVAYRLVEELGVLPRGVVEEEVRSLDQPARRLLRLFGIRFGASYIFIPALLKPAPTDWRLVLWALRQEKGAKIPARPTPGMVWTPLERDAAKGFYRTCGFKTAGDKAVRIDMLERLADNVRPLGMSGKPFVVTPEIMGLVGLSGDDFANVMRVLGYSQKEVPATELHQPEPKSASAAEPPKTENAALAETPMLEMAAADENAAQAETVEAAPVETAPVEIAAAATMETEAAAAVKQDTAAEAPAEAAGETPTENAKPELVAAFVWQPKKRGGRPHKQGGGKPTEGKKFAKGPKDGKGASPQAKHNKSGGKKSGKRPDPAAKAPPPPKHSPFAALASLKEQLKR